MYIVVSGLNQHFQVYPLIIYECVSVYIKIHVIPLVSYQLSIFTVVIFEMESRHLL